MLTCLPNRAPALLLVFALGCDTGGPGSDTPDEDPGASAVATAIELGESCQAGDDLVEVARAWARLCRYPDAPERDAGQAGLEACRLATVAAMVPEADASPETRAKKVAALTSDASHQLDLDRPLAPDNCPPPPIKELTELELLSPKEYAIEDGATTTVTFTNFCGRDIQYGFSPDLDGGPPLIWSATPHVRRQVTLPRGYLLRARVAGSEDWDADACKVPGNGHLTFNADCESCTRGRDDPLTRQDCAAAGSCTP